MKADILSLSGRFYEMFIQDTRQCDLLIIMGTSLKVYLTNPDDSCFYLYFYFIILFFLFFIFFFLRFVRYPFASLVNMVGDEVPRMLINLKSVGPFEDNFQVLFFSLSSLSLDFIHSFLFLLFLLLFSGV